jgi:hypothetical protein
MWTDLVEGTLGFLALLPLWGEMTSDRTCPLLFEDPLPGEECFGLLLGLLLVAVLDVTGGGFV